MINTLKNLQVIESVYISAIRKLTFMLIVLLCSCCRTGASAASRSLSDNQEMVKHVVAIGKQNREDTLRRQMIALFQRGEFQKVIDVGRAFYSYGERTGDEAMLMDAAMFIGQGYVSISKMDDAADWLERSLVLGNKRNDHWIIARVNDAYGVIAMCSRCDFNAAFNYFYAAFRALEQIDDGNVDERKMRYGVMINLAMAYFYRGDLDGKDYAEEVLRFGKQMKYDFFTFAGNLICGHFSFLEGNYGEALEKVREAEALVEKYYNHAEVYTLHGNILAKLGRRQEAADYYEMAMKRVGEADLAVQVNCYLDYGRFLTDDGRYLQAEKILREGLRIVEKKQVHVFEYRYYEALSKAFEKMKRPEEALAYYKIFHAEADSFFNVEKERSLNELQVKYKSEQQQRELKEKELRLEHERKKFTLAIGVIVIFLIAVVCLSLLYKYKNKTYLALVRQYYDLKQGKEFSSLQEAECAKESGNTPGDNYTRKYHQIFELLQQKMNQEELWRSKDLSIDRLAEIMGTNRTYLSQIINSLAGKSFNHYVNEYRINEAVKLLSDVDNNTALKQIAFDLGFNSLTTFYASFQRATGVPPAKFRENWRKIARRDVAS